MNKIFIKTFILLFLTVNLSAQLSEVNQTDLVNLRNSKIATGDINNDGFFDIIISGININDIQQCKVYINNRNNSFTDINANIMALTNGDIALADYDADGYLDIAISGEDVSGKSYSKIYRNHQGNTFTDIAANLKGLCYGSLAWADYDNDADLDLLICGQDENNVRHTLIYENKRNGVFVEILPGLPNVSRGMASWGDVNKDGLVDAVISGMDNSNINITEIYLNNGDRSFTFQNTNLRKLSFTEQELVDFDNDGDLDFWINGTSENGTNHSILYHNINGSFIPAIGLFKPLWNVSAAWGDFDADGDADLIYMGLDDMLPGLYYYQNHKSIFSEINLGIEVLAEGDLAFFNLDKDNRYDFLISGANNIGQATKIYRNNLAASNAPPIAPVNLKASVYKDSVSLHWNIASDSESGSNGLSYRLCIGTEPGNYNLLPGMLTNGNENKLFRQGELKGTSTYISGLTEGKYYWSVVTIDASNASSAPAVEQSFFICDGINLGDDKEVCTGEKIELDIGNPEDVVDWYSEKQGLLVSANNELIHQVNNYDRIFAIVTKPFGCIVSDTIIVTALKLPDISLPAKDSACLGSTVSFNRGKEGELVEWYRFDDNLIYSGNQLEYTIKGNETIKCVLTDANNCIDSAKVELIALELPQASLGIDFKACINDTVKLEIPGMNKVDWYCLNGYQLSEDKDNFSLQITTDTTVIALFTNEQNCSNSDTIIVKVSSLKGVDAGKDTLICHNTEARLAARVDGGAAPLVFLWQTREGEMIDTNAVINIFPKIDGKYIVTVVDKDGCKATDEVEVKVNHKPIINAGSNKEICIGESTIIGGAPTAENSLFDFLYRWEPQTGLDNPFCENPEAIPQETTCYKLIVSTYNCIADSAEVTVFVNPLPKVTISNDTIIGEGETIEIEAGGGYNYEWSPKDGLSSPYSQYTIASPAETTTYVVIVEDENVCVAKDSVTIKVSTDLFIPNLFTPNGDGQNDNFKIYGTGISELQMVIYNRSGSIVFSSGNIRNLQEKGWDGKTNGVEQPQGTYVYVISGQYVDGAAIEYNGNTGVINLMR